MDVPIQFRDGRVGPLRPVHRAHRLDRPHGVQAGGDGLHSRPPDAADLPRREAHARPPGPEEGSRAAHHDPRLLQRHERDVLGLHVHPAAAHALVDPGGRSRPPAEPGARPREPLVQARLHERARLHAAPLPDPRRGGLLGRVHDPPHPDLAGDLPDLRRGPGDHPARLHQPDPGGHRGEGGVLPGGRHREDGREQGEGEAAGRTEVRRDLQQYRRGPG
mmetsp:Transcript_98892/g.213509  ORF Transcript_98892/g.213509 Transcript_98892/m.213509 type:complete len:219 (-) Transcript_98892:836-1492(-)